MVQREREGPMNIIKTMRMKSLFFVRNRRKNKRAERQDGKSELAAFFYFCHLGFRELAPRQLLKIIRRFGIGLHPIHHPDTLEQL